MAFDDFVLEIGGQTLQFGSREGAPNVGQFRVGQGKGRGGFFRLK